MKPANEAMTHIQQIARIIVQEPDANELIVRLAEQLSLTFKANRVFVGFVQQNQIVAQNIYQDGTLSFVDRTYSLNEGSIAWVVTHKRIFCGIDEYDNPLLIAPVLNHQEHLLAIIVCHRLNDCAAFSQEDVEQIRTIALILTSAFERAQMFDKMVEWNHSFENLLAFNAALNAPVSSDVLLQRLVEHAAGFLGADAGFAALLRDHTMHSDYFWYGNIWHPFQRDWKSGSLPDWVHDNECPYLSNDYVNDLLADELLLKNFEIHNVLCVPILNAQEKAIGCICLHNKHGGRDPFTWSDAAFLESLSNSTAIVLDNVRLLKELELQREQLKALAARNIDLLEEERQRIARELHDEAGQILIGIKLGLQVLHHKMPPERDDLRAEINDLRNHVNDSTQQLKTIAHTLRPPTLDKLGLEAALRQLATEFERRCHIQIRYETSSSFTRLPTEVETACYRIVQEALTNVARHADAEEIWLTLNCNPPALGITIKDNGCGFNPSHRKAAGLGLLGMQERAITLGGKFHIQSEIGKGTLLLVQIPCVYGEKL